MSELREGYPGFGGRTVRAAVIAAVTGALLAVGLCPYAVLNVACRFVARGTLLTGANQPAQQVPGFAVLVFYLPLPAWGPLVLATAWAYRRRRRSSAPVTAACVA